MTKHPHAKKANVIFPLAAEFAPSVSDYFVGRSEVLEHLHRTLRGPRNPAIIVVGARGVGKTTLLRMFATHFATDFRGTTQWPFTPQT